VHGGQRPPWEVILVGLTGGIGSGKSTASRLLAERGAVLIDADAIVHELQRAGSPLLDALAARFGATIIRPDGELDRAALAAIAFADPAALADLNAIVHPAVREEMARRVDAQRDTDRIVVLDVPLLDVRPDGDLAAVVVVDTPVDLAVERLTSQRSMSEADARARIAAQLSPGDRLAMATHVVDNAGDLLALTSAIDDLWSQLQALAHSSTAANTSPSMTSPVGTNPNRT